MIKKSGTGSTKTSSIEISNAAQVLCTALHVTGSAESAFTPVSAHACEQCAVCDSDGSWALGVRDRSLLSDSKGPAPRLQFILDRIVIRHDCILSALVFLRMTSIRLSDRLWNSCMLTRWSAEDGSLEAEAKTDLE